MYVWDMGTGKRRKLHPELKSSAIVREIVEAIASEPKAVAFLEKWRWGATPTCAHCDSTNVYAMNDASGQRSQRYLWKCRTCGKQYTVRVGTVMTHSHIPLRHWVFALWQVVSCKKGVAALQIKRHTQISYRAALFLLNRLRHGFAHAADSITMLDEIVEADETYVGGVPRVKGVSKRGRGTKKIPVFAAVQRYGKVRAEVVVSVNGATLKGALKRMVSPTAIILTDDLNSYRGLNKHFEAHHSVNHSAKQYAREWPGKPPKAAKGDSLHSNTIESFFSLIKRGVMGIYHNISPKHLHRYVSEFEWRYNIRTLNDGDRTISAIQSMIGSRLMYRAPKLALAQG